MSILRSGLFRQCVVATRCALSTSSTQRAKIITEPPYLDAGGPDIPEYELVNIQIKGYDFSVVEHYGKWVHNTALNMGIDVEDSWATPCKKLHVQNFKPNSSIVETDYHLQIYERNVQLADLQSIMAPLFLEVIHAGLPSGVELQVHQHEEEHTKIRYIPVLELKDLKQQLDDIGGSRNK